MKLTSQDRVICLYFSCVLFLRRVLLDTGLCYRYIVSEFILKRYRPEGINQEAEKERTQLTRKADVLKTM